MPKTKTQKHDLVQEFSDKLGRSKSVVFADYQGLTMSQLAEMRSKLADNSAEFTVTKNTLLKIALDNNKLKVPDDQALSGPVATLFSYEDEISPIKVLTKAFKDFEKGTVKAGFLDGAYVSQVDINKIAELPSKDQLRGQVVGAFSGPLYGLVGVLQGNIRSLANVIDQIRQSKGGDA